VADTPELKHEEDDRIVRELHQLRADADRLRQEIADAEPRFTERRTLGIDRRRNSRTDRRLHGG
jgi:hypothetical protein